MKLHDDAALPLVPIARAQGVWLEDYDGRRYIDGISSWWVNLFGHNHPALRAALTGQFAQLDHVMLAGLTHAPAVELSERLGALTGLGHAFYGSDGASAVEIALKMSAHYWRNLGRPEKCRFVGLAGGYHGETVGALAVTDIPIFREAYGPLVRLADTVPSPDARNGPSNHDEHHGRTHENDTHQGGARTYAAQDSVARERATPDGQVVDADARGNRAHDAAERAARALAHWLEAHHAQTAALIVEPLVQCAAGMVMHDPHYLRRARELCDRHGVHLVLDEIAVGFGRTGTLFAHQQAGIRPDLICLSKGLTGGVLPLSVVLTTDTVYAAFYDDAPARGFLHSHSYTGNALACRAALATLDLFEQEDVLARNQHTAEQLSTWLAPLDQHPRVRHARRLGMIWAWDIDTTRVDFARRYARHALDHGALLRPIGNTLYLMPPYAIEAHDEHSSGAQLARAALRALDATLAEDGADGDGFSNDGARRAPGTVGIDAV